MKILASSSAVLVGLAALAPPTLVCSLLGLNLATAAFAYLIPIVFLCRVSSYFPLVALSMGAHWSMKIHS
jgi:hypothetical protein